MNTMRLFEFDSEEDAWPGVNDGVMGGVSSGRMRIADGIAVFEGTVSLENKGGFASVRSGPIGRDLSSCSGIQLRLRGDGKRYQFRIKTREDRTAPTYGLRFETLKDRWIEIELPFSEFTASFRGRKLPDDPPIEPEKIVTLGFLISEKQAGPFRLDIAWIKGLRRGVAGTEAGWKIL